MIIQSLKQNKKFLILLIIALEAVVILPTLFGFLETPDGYYYNGIHNLTPGDFHLYLSYFEQARQGSLFFKDLYTGEEQTPSLFNPFFLFFGLIGKIFKLSNITTLLIAKIIIIPVFISVLFSFFRCIFEKKSPLYLAMLFTLFSSGLGVFIAPFISSYATSGGYIHWPMDLWVPEFNVFLTLYHNPLYATALTLILLTFIFDIRSLDALSSRSCFYRFHHVRPLQRDRRTTDFFMADNPILRIAFFLSNTVIFGFFQKIYPAKPK